MGGYIFLTLLFGGIVIFFVMLFRNPQKNYRATLPLEGPIRINLSQGTGKPPLTHRLYIDVKMSQRDFDAYEATGLMGNELFSYPHPDFPDQQTSFRGWHLANNKYVDFPNIQELQGAKEQLLQSLHIVRSRIEDQKSRPTKESHEI